MTKEKNRVVACIWKLFIVISGLTGLLFQAGVMKGEFNFGMLRMFTTLSNIFVLVYFLCALVYLLNDHKGILWPPVYFAVMISICLTGCVAAIMLKDMFKDAEITMKIALFFLHDVVPVAVVLDWIFVSAKGSFKKYYTIIGMLPALCYVTVALVGGAMGYGLGHNGKGYPYPFLNVDLLGWNKVIITCVVLAVLVFLVGCLFVILDGKFKKYNDKNNKTE